MSFFDIRDLNLEEESFKELLNTGNFKIERIVSKGHKSPDGFWYDQNENEWVLLTQGTAEIEFEDETVNLKRGDYVLIVKHRKHRVISTSRTPEAIWLAVFFS
ncbi:MAG: cupin domain-containing protein [Lentisphaerales bacterium]|nr:cupin domain-containing protein [Lentisphaerales bacterium]